MMIQCIIFDLSEVLIAGLVGIERTLSRELPVPEDKILPCLAGDSLEELLLGNISEDAYLRQIIAREEWTIGTARLKRVIRNNFHNQIEGAIALLPDLACEHELALLSDHAREWIAYIESIHPFMKMFQHAFFSYDLGRLKSDPKTFSQVLSVMSCPPNRCLFIDDNPLNVAAAESIDIPSIRFVNAEQLALELQRRGLR